MRTTDEMYQLTGFPGQDSDRTEPKPGLLSALFSRNFRTGTVFYRSRALAFCAAIMLLPFLLVAAPEKSIQVVLVIAALVLPSAIAILISRAKSENLALKLQYAASFAIVIAGMVSGIGGYICLSCLLLVSMDMLVFAKIEIFRQRHVKVFAGGAIAVAAFTAFRLTPAQFSAGYGAAFVISIPVCVQILIGILEFRKVSSTGDRKTTVTAGISELSVTHSNELALILDRGGRVESAGRNVERVLSSEADTIHGRGFFERLNPLDRPVLLKICGRAGAVPVGYELSLRLRIGDIAHSRRQPDYTLFAARAFDIPDRPDHVLIMLNELYSTVQSVNSGSSDGISPTINPAGKAKFLAELSHDVRTPLNAVLGFAEMLSDPATQPKSPGAIAEYGQIIHKSGTDLQNVMNLLVDLTRIEHGAFRLAVERVTPADVLQSVEASLRDKFDFPGLNLIQSGSLHGLDWMVDRRAAMQVITSAAMNLANLEPCRSFRIDVEQDQGNVLLTITGVTLDHSGEVGLRPSENASALALALQVAGSLSQFMGGTVDVRQDFNRRFRAEIRFPLHGTMASTEQSLLKLSDFHPANFHPARVPVSPVLTGQLAKKHV